MKSNYDGINTKFSVNNFVTASFIWMIKIKSMKKAIYLMKLI